MCFVLFYVLFCTTYGKAFVLRFWVKRILLKKRWKSAPRLCGRLEGGIRDAVHPREERDGILHTAGLG